MENIFGTTPIGMLILEIVLIPLFLWVGYKLNKVIKSVDKCSVSLEIVSDRLEKLNGSLTKIQDEQVDTEIRLERIEGRIKGIDQAVRHTNQTG